MFAMKTEFVTPAANYILSRMYLEKERRSRCGLVAGILLALVAISTSLQAQTLTVLHTFEGTDGEGPNGGVIMDAAGNLYGTASGGGICCGVVFKLDASGDFSVLYQFKGTPDGNSPNGRLVRDAAGNLYGTTSMGGNFGAGTVYKLSPSGKMTILHSFSGSPDGSSPYEGLVRDAAGNLYGTTWSGGVAMCNAGAGCGTVFKVNSTGKETILHRFGAATDGTQPDGNMARDKAGNLYGSTDFGGIGFGIVYKVDDKGKETILYTFAGGSDGAYPEGAGVIFCGLVLCGATGFGGTAGAGNVYTLNLSGSETLLYSFAGPYSQRPGRLTIDATGNLYGETLYGGVSDVGALFELDTSGVETLLYSFTGGADGWLPFGGVIRDTAGNLYGTAQVGGNLTCGGSGYGCGTIFKLTP